MRIAYLTNHYPAVSHSFIRREILAVERLGHEVLRISVADGKLGVAHQEERLRAARIEGIEQSI